jgi:hypothetical protein
MRTLLLALCLSFAARAELRNSSFAGDVNAPQGPTSDKSTAAITQAANPSPQAKHRVSTPNYEIRAF